MTGVPTLPDDLVAVLRFADRHQGLTDDRLTPLVRQAFGLSLIRYRQRLAHAIAQPGAEAVAPAVVRTCRALIDRHAARRRPTPTGAP